MIVVRKLGVPFQPECGFGAIGEGGATVIDDDVVRQARLTRQAIAGVEARERARLDRRVAQLRGGRPPVPLAGRIAVGWTTGSRADRRPGRLPGGQGAGRRRVIVAVPVGAAEAIGSCVDADEVVCLHSPAPFVAIGDWYPDFSQVADAEVTGLLGRAVTCPESRDAAPDPTEVAVDAGGVPLPGSLVIPPDAGGLVVFVHGSGSGGLSPRNQFVAAGLGPGRPWHAAGRPAHPGQGTRPGERGHVALLAARLAASPAGCAIGPASPPSRLSTSGPAPAPQRPGAATATPRLPVTAIVSRSGRPDLVGGRLALVRIPTLFIVGGADTMVLDLNQRAQTQLKCESSSPSFPAPPTCSPVRGPQPGDGPGR